VDVYSYDHTDADPNLLTIARAKCDREAVVHALFHADESSGADGEQLASAYGYELSISHPDGYGNRHADPATLYGGL
jgi:hypothetical protein